MKSTKESTRQPKEIEQLRLLGLNIRKWREQKGYTQEELAPMIGITRSYITEVETGKRNISFLNLLKIIEALDVENSAIKKLMQDIQNHGMEG